MEGQLMEPLKFGQVIEGLFTGKSYARFNWNGKNQCIKLQVPDENSKMTMPYIYMEIVVPEYEAPDGSSAHSGYTQRVPWLASQSDILGDDWFEKA